VLVPFTCIVLNSDRFLLLHLLGLDLHPLRDFVFKLQTYLQLDIIVHRFGQRSFALHYFWLTQCLNPAIKTILDKAFKCLRVLIQLSLTECRLFLLHDDLLLLDVLFLNLYLPVNQNIGCINTFFVVS
jgi:hypothetical protein